MVGVGLLVGGGIPGEIIGSDGASGHALDLLHDRTARGPFAEGVKPDRFAAHAKLRREIGGGDVLGGEVFGKLHDGGIVQHSVGFVNSVLLRAEKKRGRHHPPMAGDTIHAATKVRREFADRLRSVRLGAGFTTAEEFATMLGMKQPETYRRWERGETEPNITFLRLIAKSTGIDLNFLINGRSGPHPVVAPSASALPLTKPKSSRSRQ